MKSSQWLQWAARHFACDEAGHALLGEVVGAIQQSVPPATRPDQRYESALNDGQLFRVVKLVHVCEEEGGEDHWTRDKGGERLELVLRLMALANRTAGATFDAASYRAAHRAVLAAGFSSWYPTLGFEYDVRRHRVPEMSLYSQHRPAEIAPLLAESLGTSLDLVAHPPQDLFALGFDFFADGSSRFKLYYSVSAREAPKLLEQLSPEVRPERVLMLYRSAGGSFRRAEDGGGPKAYLQLVDTVGGRLRGEELGAVAVAGRLQRLAPQIQPALEGQWLSFLAASESKAEVYFGGF